MKNIKSLAEGLKHAELNLKASLHEDGGMPVRAGWIVDECKVKLFDALTADIPLDRLCELSEAERNGRLVVLPCKVGDTVYWPSLFGSGIQQGTVVAIKLSRFGFDLEIRDALNLNLLVKKNFEKVFLSRAEAGAELVEADALMREAMELCRDRYNLKRCKDCPVRLAANGEKMVCQKYITLYTEKAAEMLREGDG